MSHPSQVAAAAAVIPPLALRIGVTGKRPRTLHEAQGIEALRPKVAAVLDFVKQHMHALAASIAREQAASNEPDAQPIYQPGEPLLRLFSSLAVGADRLVAQEANRLGYRLEAVLPFDCDEYKHDFPRQIGEFDALLQSAQGRVLELDGGRGRDEPWSYQAAGRVVVQHSDVVIAIWDGKEASGMGGTGDIVAYAIQSGVPVWWISTDPDTSPRLITEAAQLRHPNQALHRSEDAKLAHYLYTALALPTCPPPDRHGLLGQLVQLFCRRDRAPLQVYWSERQLRLRLCWRVYAMLIRVFGGAAAPGTDMPPARGQVETYWDALYCRADWASAQYGNRYRSSYVLILFMGALALICAAFGLLAQVRSNLICGNCSIIERTTGIVELVLLALILILVSVNIASLWQERWISYRMLSELCRKQRVLATVARALPIAKITDFAADPSHRPARGAQLDEIKIPREIWVSWYLIAQQRAAPILYGKFDREALHRAIAVGRSVLNQQITYHNDRAARCRKAAGRIVSAGYVLFLLTIFIILLHVVPSLFPVCKWLELAEPILSFFAIVFPVSASAFAGIRAYAEFDHLVEVSKSMVAAMEPALKKINQTHLSDPSPLASSDLGERLASVTAAMLQDVQGWAQLFRVKSVEPS